MNKDFEKMIHALKYWGLILEDPTKDENFQSRLIIQKLTHICQILGVEMKRYHFSLYKNGPYSPDLASDYYNFSSQFNSLRTDYKPTSAEIGVFDNIKEEILQHSLNNEHQADLLEAISTVSYFKDRNPKFLDDDLFEKTMNEKPYLSDKIVTIAINLVKKLRFKPEYLTKEIQDELDLWDKAED
jgi:uncharacterized protein YwgA